MALSTKAKRSIRFSFTSTAVSDKIITAVNTLGPITGSQAARAMGFAVISKNLGKSIVDAIGDSPMSNEAVRCLGYGLASKQAADEIQDVLESI